ncbi:MAG: Nif3-like dinuclear metal center hexameric protein [Chlamydiales bacterium]|nr:Nif3-like dinuclear metal center hexameric protein [Chlamydiales bacterium]
MHRLKFQKKLEDFYEHSANVAFGGKEEIETVGLVSGGSYKIISEAINRKLDCFIAGNFDEPVWNQAFEEKINFYALGHSATERIGPRALGEYLSKEYKVEHQFIDIYNPF